MKEIYLKGKISDTQWKKLLEITALVNAGISIGLRKTPEHILWNFNCTLLDKMLKRGHNRVIYMGTDFKDPQVVFEEKDGIKKI